MPVAGQALHQMSAHDCYLPAGRPDSSPTIFAIAGKPLELRWEIAEPTEDLIVQVDRITDTRRVSIIAAPSTSSGKTCSFHWDVPDTHGTVFYEVRLDDRPETAFRIETRSAEWVKKSISALSRMQWESSLLSSDELRVLSTLGITTTLAHDQGASAFLRMIPDQAKLGRRLVKWSDKELDLVVRQTNTATGDLRIQAPRWWISPKALSSDHGIIRLLDLYFQTPVKP